MESAAKILVSESDSDVERLLVAMIERLGHEAVVLRDETPTCGDVLLVEPESRTCVEKARRVLTARPGLPVVCMSLLAADQADSLIGGTITYLPKPFTLERLRATLDRWVEFSADPPESALD